MSEQTENGHSIEVLRENIKHERELREKFEKLMDERDRGYGDKLKTALDAQKEQTKSSFEASEKAIFKAEAAQNAHNILANGLQGRMDEQAKQFISRGEFAQAFSAENEKIEDIKKGMVIVREFMSAYSGKSDQSKEGKQSYQFIITLIVGVITFALGLLVNYLVIRK